MSASNHPSHRIFHPSFKAAAGILSAGGLVGILSFIMWTALGRGVVQRPAAAGPRRSTVGMNRELMFRFFEKAFWSQSIDQAWASSQMPAIDHVLSTDTQQDSEIRDKRCAESLCRIEAVHKSPRAMRTFTNNLSRQTPFRNQPTDFFYNHEALRTVVFLGRQDRPWPVPNY